MDADIEAEGVNIFFSAMNDYRRIRGHYKNIISLYLCSSLFIYGFKP